MIYLYQRCQSYKEHSPLPDPFPLWCQCQKLLIKRWMTFTLILVRLPSGRTSSNGREVLSLLVCTALLVCYRIICCQWVKIGQLMRNILHLLYPGYVLEGRFGDWGVCILCIAHFTHLLTIECDTDMSRCIELTKTHYFILCAWLLFWFWVLVEEASFPFWHTQPISCPSCWPVEWGVKVS